MKETGYYPVGTEYDPNSPWNQKENQEREIEVTASITLSKTVTIKVSDYTIIDSGKDENGEYFEDIDYSSCDLKSAVEDQIILPQDAHIYLGNYAYEGGYTNPVPEVKDLENWNVDDFEVILE